MWKQRALLGLDRGTIEDGYLLEVANPMHGRRQNSRLALRVQVLKLARHLELPLSGDLTQLLVKQVTLGVFALLFDLWRTRPTDRRLAPPVCLKAWIDRLDVSSSMQLLVTSSRTTSKGMQASSLTPVSKVGLISTARASAGEHSTEL